MKYIIRALLETDYESAVKIWEACSITLGASDSKEEILKFMKKNPSTCFGAENNGILTGTVLGGFDGRRGLIHHLAVLPQYRALGIAKKLMMELENSFNKIGVVKINFWVEKRNIEVVKFYEKLGYELRDDILTMSKTFLE